jgi:hypothetical protein
MTHLIEIWLATSIVGATAAVIGIFLGIGDLRFAHKVSRRLKDNDFLFVAGQRLFAQSVRLMSFSIEAVIGFGAVQVGADPDPTPAILGLIIANIGLSAVCVSDALTGLLLRERAMRRKRVVVVAIDKDDNDDESPVPTSG